MGMLTLLLLEELLSSQGNFVKVNLYTNEEGGCDSRDKSILQEVMLAENFTGKELLEIPSDIESAKDK